MKQILTNTQGGTYYRVNTEVEAWEIAHELIDNLQFDAEGTERGVGKHWCNPDKSYVNVIHLGDHFEVNMESGETQNIWIEQSETETLRTEVSNLTAKNASLEEAIISQIKLWTAQKGEISLLNAALAERDRDITALKAKLYDLMTVGA